MNILVDFFCKHEYELLDKVTVYDQYYIKGDLPIGKKFTYVCKKCGRVKRIKTY